MNSTQFTRTEVENHIAGIQSEIAGLREIAALHNPATEHGAEIIIRRDELTLLGLQALLSGEPVAFEGAETVYLIQTIDQLPELFSGAETCWDCHKSAATNVLTVVRGGNVAYHLPACWPCAAKAQNGGVAPEPPPALTYPEPVEALVVTPVEIFGRPGINPRLMDDVLGAVSMPSKTTPNLTHVVTILDRGENGMAFICDADCKGFEHHGFCAHTRDAALLWSDTQFCDDGPVDFDLPLHEFLFVQQFDRRQRAAMRAA